QHRTAAETARMQPGRREPEGFAHEGGEERVGSFAQGNRHGNAVDILEPDARRALQRLEHLAREVVGAAPGAKAIWNFRVRGDTDRFAAHDCVLRSMTHVRYFTGFGSSFRFSLRWPRFRQTPRAPAPHPAARATESCLPATSAAARRTRRSAGTCTRPFALSPIRSAPLP